MKDKETMKEKLHETAGMVKEKAENVKEDIKKGAHAAKEKAEEMKENLKNGLRDERFAFLKEDPRYLKFC